MNTLNVCVKYFRVEKYLSLKYRRYKSFAICYYSSLCSSERYTNPKSFQRTSQVSATIFVTIVTLILNAEENICLLPPCAKYLFKNVFYWISFEIKLITYINVRNSRHFAEITGRFECFVVLSFVKLESKSKMTLLILTVLMNCSGSLLYISPKLTAKYSLVSRFW